MGGALAAFLVVFVAEFGDRTQLLIATLAARHALAPVLGGLALGYALTNLLAVVVGSLLGSALPDRAVGVVGGLLFLAFAVWTLLGDEDDDEDDAGPRGEGRSRVAVALGITTAIVVSELGDKSMLATATLATDGDPVAVWIGATLGILAAGTIGALVGRVVGDRIPARALQVGSAALFAVFGVVLLVGALRGG